MKGVRDLCSRRTVIALVLGQVVSLLITSTGFSSSELARRGINVPTSQSFLNYVLLAIVFGSIVIHRGKGLRTRWYYYVLLAFVDVEANYLVVRAYQYTSITSVMLLDCWTIPCVIFLTWLCLKTKYKISQFIGVFVCVAGLVLVVFSDVHASDRQRGSRPVLGDMLVVGGSMLYAISNVSEEFFVKNVDRVELMAMLGLFGATISACQLSIFEHHALSSIQWNPRDVLPFIGYAVALFCFYVLVPILLKISGAALLNLSLLTSDMWAVLIRIFAYNQKVDWMYFLAFGVVAVGLLIYTSRGEEDTVHEQPKEDVIQDNIGYKPVNEDPNLGEKAEEELIGLGAPKERNALHRNWCYTKIYSC
ncbi:hypothetical protein SUGI_0402500 [Cryptomeria japonica]|uniref:uncharacterized protein LOC131033733 isoform X2 n=1 Tax=Cryptomeria japonica TaxID=3369 RepID=UPI0024089FD2|nr:uncharacterized protein LOC131033733 isoform X2 [Cryptomeria japonica]GLJ21625.1 hypothetical protein SUGI_0402500 [Cryptomeria japonica]